MAYEDTTVPTARSKDQIHKLIMARKGARIAFITDPPREGFSAVVEIDGDPYTVRIFGELKPASGRKTEKQQQAFAEGEARRIWRVLFYHLKSVFEAADSGVMEFRELILPYIVTSSGKTIAEHIVPNLAQAVERNPARLLG